MSFIHLASSQKMPDMQTQKGADDPEQENLQGLGFQTYPMLIAEPSTNTGLFDNLPPVFGVKPFVSPLRICSISSLQNDSDSKEEEVQVASRGVQISKPKESKNECSFGNLGDLSLFNFQSFDSPVKSEPDTQNISKSEQDNSQVEPKKTNTVYLSARTPFVSRSPMISQSTDTASFSDFNSISLSNMGSMSDYPISSQFATTPRSNGKSFAVSPDSKTTFWNFSTFDGNSRSASLGRQRSASGSSPFRLSQQNGMLLVASTNPYTTSGENECPANGQEPRSRLSVYSEELTGDEGLDDRERMRAIEALLSKDKQEPAAESYELKSSFNLTKCYDPRVYEDVNREMIRDYLLQRQGDQAQTSLFGQTKTDDSIECPKSEQVASCGPTKLRKSKIPETTVDMSNGGGNPGDSESDHELNKVGQSNLFQPTPTKYKTSKDLYRSSNSKKSLSKGQMNCLTLTGIVPYCIWVFITNLLLLAFFWVYID